MRNRRERTYVQSTAPMNIVKNLQTEKICKLKCSYQFNYTPTTLQITNYGVFLLMMVDEVATPPVIYNDENYRVQMVILLPYSTHQFNGTRSDAELIIFHTNNRGTKTLAIIVPIKASSTTTSESATFFDLIMAEVSQTAPTSGQRTIYNNPNLSLNKFVPMKPYFAYEGKFGQSNGQADSDQPLTTFLVYHLDDAITIGPQALRTMKKVCKEARLWIAGIPVREEAENPGGIYYNPDGPVPQSSGEIFIDCQPTGDDGEVLVAARMDSKGLLDNAALKKIWNFRFMKIIVGAIIMILLWRLAIKMIDGIASSSARMAGGGGKGGGAKLAS